MFFLLKVLFKKENDSRSLLSNLLMVNLPGKVKAQSLIEKQIEGKNKSNQRIDSM